MTRVVSRARNRQERGSILILAAIILPTILIFAGLASGAAHVYGANQEGRRAADMAALNAAANLPTLNFGDPALNPYNLPGPDKLGTPYGPVDLTGGLPTVNAPYQSGACQMADKQLSSRRSVVTESYKLGDPTCEITFHAANEWIDRLAKCIDVISNPTCAAQLPQAIGSALAPLGLPVDDDALSGPLEDALVAAATPGQVLTQSAYNALKNPSSICSSLPATVTETVLGVPVEVPNPAIAICNAAVGGLLNPAAGITGPIADTGLITSSGGLNLDLKSLSPALLTPTVTATVRQRVSVPGASLVGADDVHVRNSATARRTFKNALLVPTATVPLGPLGPGVTFDINPALDTAQGPLIEALRGLDEFVSGSPAGGLNDALIKGWLCPEDPSSCPSATGVFSEFATDLEDLLAPGEPQKPASANQIVRDAQQSGEPVLIGVMTRPVQSMRQIVTGALGSGVCAPPLGGVLAEVCSDTPLNIPAFEFVPAVLSGPLNQPVATVVNMATVIGASPGLYRARLID